MALRVEGPVPARIDREILRFSYHLPHAAVVDLAVYDVRGRLVRRLLVEGRQAGRGEIDWDGRDEDGRPAASGVYLVRLATEREARTRKIAVMR